MDINPYHLLYIIREQQLEYCDINISHIICQYAKLNLWDYESGWLYSNTFHMCVIYKGINPEGWCGCKFKSWQEFIDVEYLYSATVHKLLIWEWFNKHSTYCDLWSEEESEEEEEEEEKRGSEEESEESESEEWSEEEEEEGGEEEAICECSTNGKNILQLGFLWHEEYNPQPDLVYARINVSKNDEEKIRKFINNRK